MQLLWINSIGIIIIGLIIYWFWFSKPRAVKTSGRQVNITVDNGVYTPASIEFRAGEQIKLNFLRKDPTPCAEKVVFSGLNISEELPINKEKVIVLKVDQPGEYEFCCEMQMYRGRIIVK